MLIGNPCTSYLGVKIAASKMIGFDDLPSSSESDISNSSGGEEEIHELYD